MQLCKYMCAIYKTFDPKQRQFLFRPCQMCYYDMLYVILIHYNILTHI